MFDLFVGFLVFLNISPTKTKEREKERDRQSEKTEKKKERKIGKKERYNCTQTQLFDTFSH